MPAPLHASHLARQKRRAPADFQPGPSSSDNSTKKARKSPRRYCILTSGLKKTGCKEQMCSIGKVAKRVIAEQTFNPLPSGGDVSKPAYIVTVPTTDLQGDKIDHIIQLFAQQGFAASDRDQGGYQRMAIVFGINAMQRLQKGVGRQIKAAVERDIAQENAPFCVKKFGFAWSPVWVECRADNVDQCSKEGHKKCSRLSFSEMRKIFRDCVGAEDPEQKRLKSQLLREENAVLGRLSSNGSGSNPKPASARERRLANEFRINVIPYARILDKIRTYQGIEALQAAFRAKDPKRAVYVLLQHSDVQRLVPTAFRFGAQGLLSSYDTVINAHVLMQKALPQVVSTGYLTGEQRPFIRFAVELDMRVRSIMNKYVPGGPYFPEPNSALLVPKGEKHLPWSFESSGKGLSSRLEMVTFIRNMRRLSEEKDPAKLFAFAHEYAVTIRARGRMIKYGGRSSDKTFGGRFSQKGELVGWTHQDLKHWCGMAQSHLPPLDWAKSIVRGLEPDLLGEQGDSIKGRSTLNGIISELYSVYYPVATDKDMERLDISFNAHLQQTLQNYDTPVSKAARLQSAEKVIIEKLIPALKQTACKDKRAQEIAPTIAKAAKESGQAVADMLSKKLSFDFLELCIGHIENAFGFVDVTFEGARLDDAGVSPSALYDPDSVYHAIIANTLAARLNNELDMDKIYQHLDEQPLLPHNCTAMHIAAFSGHRALVRALVESEDEEKMSLAGHIEALTEGGLLPLHAAIVYLAQFGRVSQSSPDLELIDLLTRGPKSKEIVSSLIGTKPVILFAIDQITAPVEVVRKLVTLGANYNAECERTGLTPLHASLGVSDGFSFNEPDWPLFEYLMGLEGIDIEARDEEGQSPLDAALDIGKTKGARYISALWERHKEAKGVDQSNREALQELADEVLVERGQGSFALLRSVTGDEVYHEEELSEMEEEYYLNQAADVVSAVDSLSRDQILEELQDMNLCSFNPEGDSLYELRIALASQRLMLGPTDVFESAFYYPGDIVDGAYYPSDEMHTCNMEMEYDVGSLAKEAYERWGVSKPDDELHVADEPQSESEDEIVLTEDVYYIPPTDEAMEDLDRMEHDYGDEPLSDAPSEEGAEDGYGIVDEVSYSSSSESEYGF